MTDDCTLRFGSVCSGIEAASVAWNPLGWSATWVAEIELFPSAVLAHYYPEVPNYGDMTALPERILSGEIEAPDVFCGGTPCQAFSIAGLRKSLDDARGNLSLTFCEIANAIDDERIFAGLQPGIIFWENVPGVLSTKDNAFGCFLAGLAGEDVPLEPSGGKWTDAGAVLGPKRAVAWRVLDAQYFGLAQRRKRVFVVASARDGFDPAAVLFEFDGVRRDTAPSREAGQVAAPTIAGCANGGGANGPGRDVDSVESLKVVQPYAVANCLTQRMHKGINSTLDEGQTPVLAHSLRGEGFDASEDGAGRGTPLVPVGAHAFDARQSDVVQYGDQSGPLDTDGHSIGVLAFQSSQSGVRIGETHATLDAHNGPRRHNGALVNMQLRRLTPVEWERLQGFPDGYTAIPWRGKPADQCPDGPRYKALGNSWAVPVARWIGARIGAHLQGAQG